MMNTDFTRMKFLISRGGYAHLPKEEAEEIMLRRVYDAVVQCLEGKAYLDPDLSINNLAELTRIPAYKISLAANRVGKHNIKELINRYRVENALRLLEDPNFWYYTIDAVGMETGFNNRVSFINTFKKMVGITPHAYRLQMQEQMKQAS